jgi:hypothetical protein
MIALVHVTDSIVTVAHGLISDRVELAVYQIM